MSDVLVVEDNDQIRQAFCAVVTRLGHMARSATCFTTAVLEMNAAAPDMILTDWDLGDDSEGSGIDVARYSLATNPDTSVVMITGNDIEQLKHNTCNLSISCYIKKPVDLSGLQFVLRDLLRP